MNKTIISLLAIALLLTGSLFYASAQDKPPKKDKKKGTAMTDKVEKTDAEWKKILNPEQYDVLRKKGTERPFTGKYWNSHEKGKYVCAACGLELFASQAKFDSECGWPSFSAPADKKHVAEREDNSYGMRRIEVYCPRCGGHLGHVFEDGPAPTGLRYCINSASLNFIPDEAKKK